MDLMCFEIINSSWHITHEPFFDPLQDKRWVADFLKKWGLENHGPVESSHLDRLAALRSFLTAAAQELLSGAVLSEKHISEMNRYLALDPYYHVLQFEADRYALHKEPTTTGWHVVEGRIVHSFAQLIDRFDLKRIKLCENPECRWIFYDASKNASRCWCGNTCASLIKVRRFRSRQKENRV